MRVLVTGCEGQLVRSLLGIASGYPDIELIAVGRPLLNLAEPGSATAAIRAAKPELVINAAAYTAVDRAEAEPELAFRVNANAAGEVAAAAREIGVPVIQLSTDYVFDGRASEPYREDSPTNPLNVYGASKLKGEEAVRAANPRHLILRTSWLYSPFGSNFVGTMLRLADEQEEVRVVNDQLGCPTSALDLAGALLHVASTDDERLQEGCGGTLHLAGGEPCSWAEFAEHIFRFSREANGPSAAVVPIRSRDFSASATRPERSVLDSSAFFKRFGVAMPSTMASLQSAVLRLLATRE